jgi:hypothetical protein
VLESSSSKEGNAVLLEDCESDEEDEDGDDDLNDFVFITLDDGEDDEQEVVISFI